MNPLTPLIVIACLLTALACIVLGFVLALAIVAWFVIDQINGGELLIKSVEGEWIGLTKKVQLELIDVKL